MKKADDYNTNWCSAAVSTGEQFPEEGLERLKHV
jgi:hypothetical protein